MTTQKEIDDFFFNEYEKALRHKHELQMSTKEYKEGKHEQFIADKGVQDVR